MSVESARAFCVRMMSDDEFRTSLGVAPTAAAINGILAAESYDFSKSELSRVIGEFMNRKLNDEELLEMICGFYKEEMNSGADASCDAVVEWLKNKA